MRAEVSSGRAEGRREPGSPHQVHPFSETEAVVEGTQVTLDGFHPLGGAQPI